MAWKSSQVATYLAVLVSFAVIDGAWIAFVAGPMFRNTVGAIMLDEPNLIAALPFYAIYALGIFVLAVQPSLAAGSSKIAYINGGVLGLTAYATFEFTSLAILKGWTMALVVPDLIWGTLLTAIVALIGHKFAMRYRVNFGPG